MLTFDFLSSMKSTTLSVFSMSGIFSRRPRRLCVRFTSMYRYLLRSTKSETQGQPRDALVDELDVCCTYALIS